MPEPTDTGRGSSQVVENCPTPAPLNAGSVLCVCGHRFRLRRRGRHVTTPHARTRPLRSPPRKPQSLCYPPPNADKRRLENERSAPVGFSPFTRARPGRREVPDCARRTGSRSRAPPFASALAHSLPDVSPSKCAARVSVTIDRGYCHALFVLRQGGSDVRDNPDRSPRRSS